MTRDELHEAVLRCLGRIAPEVDVGSLAPGVRLRDQGDEFFAGALRAVEGGAALWRLSVPATTPPLTRRASSLRWRTRRIGLPARRKTRIAHERG